MNTDVSAAQNSNGDYLVFIAGLILCFLLIYLLIKLINSSRHGGTVSTLGSAIVFSILGIFCIATPKISRLIFDYGTFRLRVAENAEVKKNIIAQAKEIQLSRQLAGNVPMVKIVGSSTQNKKVNEIVDKIKENRKMDTFDTQYIAVLQKKIDSSFVPIQLKNKEWLILSTKEPLLFGANSSSDKLESVSIDKVQYEKINQELNEVFRKQNNGIEK